MSSQHSGSNAELQDPSLQVMHLIAHMTSLLSGLDQRPMSDGTKVLLTFRGASMLSHLDELHKLRDEKLRKEIHKTLGDEAAATDDWSHFNRFCEMN